MDDVGFYYFDILNENWVFEGVLRLMEFFDWEDLMTVGEHNKFEGLRRNLRNEMIRSGWKRWNWVLDFKLDGYGFLKIGLEWMRRGIE